MTTITGAKHKATMKIESEYVQYDRFLTPEEALQERIARLRAMGTKFVREGMSISFTAENGDKITIIYQEVPTA